MRKNVNAVLLVLFAVFAIGISIWGATFSIRYVWRVLVDVNSSLAVAVIAAASTLMATTITVMLGRYFERKRDIEAHFRADKIKFYDEFLRELFTVFHADGAVQDAKLVKVLQEWQRKLVLWGGHSVLTTYFKWMNHLKSGNINADSMFLMDDFFRALRSDIGQSSRGLPRGAFVHLIMRHGDFFLEEAAKNPSITLEQLTVLEKARFGDK